MRPFRATLIIVLLALALGAPAWAEPMEILQRAARADRPLPEWEELDEELRFRAMLAGLFGEDDLVALFAAEHLDAFRLTLVEQRRGGSLVAEHPERYFGDGGNPERLPLHLLGVREVAAIWTAVVAGGIDFQQDAEEPLVTHRPTAPEHLPLLVGLLPRARPATFRWLAQILASGADGIDRHREEVVRGLSYALARLDAEAEGREPPDPEAIGAGASGPGLPPAFVTLASAAWEIDARSPERRKVVRACLPTRFLARWSRELTPAPENLPFLARAAREGATDRGRVAAIRLLGRLDVPEVPALLRELSSATTLPATFAAAELARRGMPERFLELCEKDHVEIPLACEVASEYVLERMEQSAGEWTSWSVGHFAGAHRLSEFEAEWGVPRSDEFIATVVAAHLGNAERDPFTVSGLLLNYPWLLTAAAEDRLLARLREWAPEDPEWWVERLPDPAAPLHEQDLAEILGSDLMLLLGVLEVRRAEGLREVLAVWSKADSPFLPGAARMVLARLDGPADLDPEVLDRLGWSEPEGDEVEECWVRYRALRARGEAREAVFALTEDWPELLADVYPVLALHPDDRLRALFRRMRADRRAYWPATFGLAAAGDPKAREEALAFLRDGRTWMFDRLNEPATLTCAADPEFIAHWVDRLEAGCCQAWPSCWVLGMVFPQLDLPEIVRGHLAAKRRVEKVLGPAGGLYGRSRILSAWVPLR